MLHIVVEPKRHVEFHLLRYMPSIPCLFASTFLPQHCVRSCSRRELSNSRGKLWTITISHIMTFLLFIVCYASSSPIRIAPPWLEHIKQRTSLVACLMLSDHLTKAFFALRYLLRVRAQFPIDYDSVEMSRRAKLLLTAADALTSRQTHRRSCARSRSRIPEGFGGRTVNENGEN